MTAPEAKGVSEAALSAGMLMAAKVFDMRQGKRKTVAHEAHVDREELAAMLAVAFQAGIEFAQRRAA